MTDLIGYAAATLTTVAFFPQALLTYRTKRAEGVSLAMYSVFVVGIALWLAYGLLLGKGPIIAANAVTLLLASFILGMKIRYGLAAALALPIGELRDARATARAGPCPPPPRR